MGLEEPPELPEGLSPIGSLPGQASQPTPEEMASKSNSLNNPNLFIDFDQIEWMSHEQKLKLVQQIAERFVFGHLSGMNGSVGSSTTLRPDITDNELVYKYRRIATHLWRQGSGLPKHMSEEDIETLINIATTDRDGEQKFFTSVIQEPQIEPNELNPYLNKTSLAFHDARMLDHLIKELYIKPATQIVGFTKN